MKKLLILLWLVVFCANAGSQESLYNKNYPLPMELLDSWEGIDEIIISFKRYGLLYCIHTFDKTGNEYAIARSLRYHKLKLLHQDGDEIRQKRLEKYIHTTMLNSKNNSLGILANDDGTMLYSIACLNIYESKDYMQEIDRILRPYYLDSVFPKAYQERYKKTIQQFLDIGQTLKSAFDEIAPKYTLQAASYALIYQWDSEPSPSFDCDKNTNTAETLICFGSWKYNVFLDNFYASYYHTIMQNISNDRKAELKKIAKEMINKRNKEITRKNEEEYTDEEWARKRSALDLAWQEEIGSIISKHYEDSIAQLTYFILQYSPNLFAKIFHRHTQEYQIILRDRKADYYLILGALYFDNLIDKTGKLIIEVD